MEFKSVKVELPFTIFFSILLPIVLLVSLGNVISRDYEAYIISGTITFHVTLSAMLAIAQRLAYYRESGMMSLLLAAGISRGMYAVRTALSEGLSTLLVVPLLLIFGVLFFHLSVASPLMLVIASFLQSSWGPLWV
jgi:ABC-2 type transport system permease protein